jgi:rRNA-processing protein FCF1
MAHDPNTNDTLIKTTVRIPQAIIDQLKEAGRRHRRNFNSELIVALEDYLTNWKNQH